MFNVKKKFVRDYRNIIILMLLLAIFFSLGNMFFERKVYAASYLNEKDKSEEILYKAIYHVFPAGAIKDGKGALDSIKSVYASVSSNFFFVDIKNPYTFIRSQFPGMQQYHDVLAMSNKNGEKHEGEKPINSPDFTIIFEGDGTITTGGNIKDGQTAVNSPELDRDDLGELEGGVYIPGEIVIDSRTAPGSVSVENLKLPEKIKFEEGKPQILIYHTHGTEAYQPIKELNQRTLRKEFSVIAIAEIIKSELENQGFNVLHDNTYHDYPSYQGSYTRSLATVQDILKKNPSIKVVIDLHRDGYQYPDNENMIRNSQWTYNNETMAKYFLVIGPESPNRGKVETFAHFVKAVSDQKYPGFSKPVLVKPLGKYNQYVVDHYALIELGSNANTIEEAKRSAYLFAEVFGEALKHISK